MLVARIKYNRKKKCARNEISTFFCKTLIIRNDVISWFVARTQLIIGRLICCKNTARHHFFRRNQMTKHWRTDRKLAEKRLQELWDRSDYDTPLFLVYVDVGNLDYSYHIIIFPLFLSHYLFCFILTPLFFPIILIPLYLFYYSYLIFLSPLFLCNYY